MKGREGNASRSTLGGKDEGEGSDGPTPHGPSVDETNMRTPLDPLPSIPRQQASGERATSNHSQCAAMLSPNRKGVRDRWVENAEDRRGR